MMKIVPQRIVALLLFCSLSVAPLTAQELRRPRQGDNPEMDARHEQMRELMFRQREEYLQVSMGISDEVAEPFFELYKEYNNERYELFKTAHERLAGLDKEDILTSEQYTEAITMLENLPRLSAEIGIAYNKKFAEILTPKQLYLFMRAEQSFARDVLNDAKRGEGSKGGDGERDRPPRR